MPCDMALGIDPERLVAQGWSLEEIAELQNDVAVGKSNARKVAMQRGMTREQGQQLEDKVDAQTRQVAHDRHHARLEEKLLKGELPEHLENIIAHQKLVKAGYKK